MFRKISNKTLLIIFAILVIIAIAVYLYDSHKGERTFKSELFRVDSASVTAITIYKKGAGKDFIKLVKAGNAWDIQVGNKHYPADTSMLKNMLHALTKITPERVAGSDKESWKEFEMTDSLSTRVVVEQGSNVVADFRVGRLSFSQGRNRQSNNGYGMEVKSHIRVPGDDDVYVVDGFLSSMFNDNPARYRYRQVVRFDKKDVTKMSFVYPGDSSFNLVRDGNKWLLNGQPPDSALTERWLTTVSTMSNAEFADNDNLPFNMPYSLRIEGNNMRAIDVKGAMDPAAKKYYVTSSENTSAVFGGSSSYLFNQVFPGKQKFFEAPKADKKKEKK